jgi:hypothetical protein
MIDLTAQNIFQNLVNSVCLPDFDDLKEQLKWL